MEPTAPAAPDTKTVSPGLGSPSLSRPTHAVWPGIPATPRKDWGWIGRLGSLFIPTLAGAATNASRQPAMDVTRSPGLYPLSREASTWPTAPPVIGWLSS